MAVVLVVRPGARVWTYVNYPEGTTNEYTPIVASDGGRFLRVIATYTDPLSAMDDHRRASGGRLSTVGTERVETPSLRNVMATTENAVHAAEGQEPEPSFTDGTSAITRYVRENIEVGGSVGAPIAAMISGGANLTYELLEGADAKYFVIDATTDSTAEPATVGGQIKMAGDDNPDEPADE